MKHAKQLLFLTPCLRERELADLDGQPLGREHCRKLITADTDAYTPRGLLFAFRRGVIKEEVCAAALPPLRRVARVPGRIGTAGASAGARSNSFGFMPPRGPWPYCHPGPAMWGLWADPAGWQAVQDLARTVALAFKEALPHGYAELEGWALRTCPDFLLPGTPFTTGTVNLTHRFVCHRHRDNFGFGAMTVARSHGYRGCELILPRYGVAVDVRAGDLLLFRGREWHGNAPITPTMPNTTAL